MGAGVNPRITITSHTDHDNNIVWYLGGQLAEEGVNRTDSEQIEKARQEVAALIPWQKLEGMQWATLDINRAEVQYADGHRPDTFFAGEQGDIITAWPTKLALAPMLAQQVLELVSGIGKTTSELPDWPAPPLAEYPWCEQTRWAMV
jgi:hypothetical protein